MATKMAREAQGSLMERKEGAFKVLEKALKGLGLEGLDLTAARVRVKRVPLCPPGTEAKFEAVTNADGSVTFQWVCK